MKSKVISTIFIAIIFLTLLVRSGAAKEKVLKLALYTYPPISYEQNGDWGYCHDMVKDIFEGKGYRVEPTLYPVIRAIVQTENLLADAICCINPYNSSDLALATYPNARLTYSFWVSTKSNFTYTGIDSLKGRDIINIKGYNYTIPGKDYQNFLKDVANASQVIKLSGDDPLSRAFQMIDKGRADTICLDEPSAKYVLNKINMVNSFRQAGRLPNVLYGYFGVSKKHPEKDTLLTIYNEGHLKLYKSGKLAALIQKKGIELWKPEEGKR